VRPPNHEATPVTALLALVRDIDVVITRDPLDRPLS
jgi:hypothetical protein